MFTYPENEIGQLKLRAFGVVDWVEVALRRYYSLRKTDKKIASDKFLLKLSRWMFVPPTLWPFNVRDLFESFLAVLEKHKKPTQQMQLIVGLLPDAPEKSTCELVADHELHVQIGQYENLTTTQAKYHQNELAVRFDPALQIQWSRIKAAFKVDQYRETNGVIRRSMMVERNLRSSFSVNMTNRREVFQAAFDAFCLRWNLYGMQHDEPLLMKLSVNLTAYGTMIHIPAYWSFDPKRDIRWGAIAKLHRARVTGRQGATLAEGLVERRKAAEKLRHLDKEVARLGLKGSGRHAFLCAGLGWVPETSPKRISRLRAEFKKAPAVKTK
jgi:hypothetical protein